jgi:hypothetical protein
MAWLWVPPAVEVGEQIEGHRPMLDLLRAMPTQQIHHGGVRTGGVQRGCVERPVAQHCRDVLDRRDDC